jgi:hypothetical protein
MGSAPSWWDVVIQEDETRKRDRIWRHGILFNESIEILMRLPCLHFPLSTILVSSPYICAISYLE